jgi:cell division protein FtsQ
MASASTAAARRRRAAAKPRPRRKPAAAALRRWLPASWRTRAAIVLALFAATAAGYLLWFRHSSLVAVDDVEVVGLSGPDRAAVTERLTRLGEGMSTLDVDSGALERAAAQFPTVQSIAVDPNFPHGLRIEVTERRPVMLVAEGDERIPVAADGTLLPQNPEPDGGLPVLELKKPPPAAGLEGAAADQAVIAGAAPEPLRPLLHEIEHTPDHGIVVTLRGGIPVYFGTPAEAGPKWAAAAAVLADPKLESLNYLDVRVARRPAVGGAAGAIATESQG